jgi:hypothetical protein
MQFQNRLPGAPSPPALARHKDEATRAPKTTAACDSAPAGCSAASGSRIRSHLQIRGSTAGDQHTNKDRSPQTPSEWDTSRRSILAVLARVMAQVLEDIAEFGQAMYPSFFDSGEHINRHDPAERSEDEGRARDPL